MKTITNVLNSKRVLFSGLVIVAVAAGLIASTGAYFNDTETSTGNIFTAGSIDLKVDHTKQTYNGVDCKTCSVDIYSDTSNMVTATNHGSDPVSLPHPAKVVTPTSVTNTYWTATVPGASWIWATDPVLAADIGNNTSYTFEKTFTWYGPFTGAIVNFAIAADNSYVVKLNGTQIAADPAENNFSATDAITVDLTPYIVQGVNKLEFIVTDKAQPGGSVLGNPAGLLYALHIDGDCGDNFFQNQCSLFGEKDLGPNDHFFNFNDIKPQDWGTNLISLHVTSNDAYTCLIPNNVTNDENGVIDPEIEAGDNNAPTGELSGELEFFGWQDDGDGVYESGEIPVIPAGTSLDDMQSQMIAMPLTTSQTGYIGLAWCAGDQTLSGTTLNCDGNGMSNIAQTDKATADLVAYAVQQRNNSNFSCSSVNLNAPQGPIAP